MVSLLLSWSLGTFCPTLPPLLQTHCRVRDRHIWIPYHTIIPLHLHPYQKHQPHLQSMALYFTVSYKFMSSWHQQAPPHLALTLILRRNSSQSSSYLSMKKSCDETLVILFYYWGQPWLYTIRICCTFLPSCCHYQNPFRAPYQISFGLFFLFMFLILSINNHLSFLYRFLCVAASSHEKAQADSMYGSDVHLAAKISHSLLDVGFPRLQRLLSHSEHV